MKLSREHLREGLESYALDLLDDESMVAFERALADHPDLARTAAQMQQALARLAYQDRVPTPPALRGGLLEAAADRRTPGWDADGIVGVGGVSCYRQVVRDVSSLIDELSEVEMDAMTIYRIPVRELISHLSGMESYLTELLEAAGSEDAVQETEAFDHRAVREHGHPTDPLAVVTAWHAHVEEFASVISSWSTKQAESTVQLGSLSLQGEALLITRAFELWTHAEDICRATGRPLRPPAPEVLRSMADTAVDLLRPMIGSRRPHRGKTLRVTLTGSGGGSWVWRVGAGAGDPEAPDAFCSAEATLVANVIDFCRLAADRVVPEDGVHFHRTGDESLADELLRLTPLLSDFGAGPLEH